MRGSTLETCSIAVYGDLRGALGRVAVGVVSY